MEMQNDDREAYSVEEFCSRHSIGRATFYQLKKRGQAPQTFKIGARTLISKEAAAEWRREMEARSA
jgi:predicted DNA-binding transcriptional regulator AlpA